MGRIPMRGGFTIIPEGEYVFTVGSAKYDEDFGKIEVKLSADGGKSLTERYNIKNADDSYNDKALNAFSYLAKNVMNDFDMEDVDVSDLIGRKVKGTVVHTSLPSRTDPNRTVTFANLTDLEPVEFEAAVDDDIMMLLGE